MGERYKDMKKNNKQNLIIIGGGIMGLFTAYYASQFVKNIIVLEKSTIGNKQAASFSFTRSIRNDYLDPQYSRLAYEARSLWLTLQEKSKEQFLFTCGCLNLVKRSVTPAINTTYAFQSYKNEKNLNFFVKKFTKNGLLKTFPQFKVDTATLDVQAGFLYLPIITNFLLKALEEKNIKIIEEIDVISIEEKEGFVALKTSKGSFTTENIVITAALGTNDVVSRIKNNTVQFPLFPDRPQECKYVYIPKKYKDIFSPEKFPVFAYLDVGIYGHPIFDEKKSCIKIGFYNPPDMQKKLNKKIASIDDFVKECMPILKDVKREVVKDADQCSYDMVGDDNFILGKLPGFKNISVGCGWRGTGYKFAPLIGKILMQLSIQKETIYDIQRFSPERFVQK